ncbi:ATP-dependent helicase fft2 [Actinomortierella ambigua]|nr:ATP-dependent helicase fft2 [Actinomortierella ambigua]
MEAGKVKVLQELLPKKINDEGSKVLIFSQFTMVLDILEPVMKTMKIKYLRMDGQTKVEERQPLIDTFNDTDEYPVFLLSTKAGGFGINLTAANIVIMYDLDFNPHNDKQAEDRAHRVGQTREVEVIKLIAKNTIEEQILELANLKLKLDQHVSQDDASMSESKSTKAQGASGGAGGSGGDSASTPSAGILNLLRQNWKATLTQHQSANATSESSSCVVVVDSKRRDGTSRRSSVDSAASSSSSLSSAPTTSP